MEEKLEKMVDFSSATHNCTRRMHGGDKKIKKLKQHDSYHATL